MEKGRRAGETSETSRNFGATEMRRRYHTLVKTQTIHHYKDP